jgi:hypothetical protein
MSGYANSRPMQAATCATSLTPGTRSSRAISGGMQRDRNGRSYPALPASNTAPKASCELDFGGRASRSASTPCHPARSRRPAGTEPDLTRIPRKRAAPDEILRLPRSGERGAGYSLITNTIANPSAPINAISISVGHSRLAAPGRNLSNIAAAPSAPRPAHRPKVGHLPLGASTCRG